MKVTFLTISILLLGLSQSLGLGSINRPSTLILNPRVVFEAGASYIRFDFENRGSNSVLILTSAFSQEGQRPEVKNYFYIPSGGERQENVLEYVPNTETWPGILGHPVRYLHREDMGHLVEIGPRSKMSVKLRWDDGLKLSEHYGTLRVRAKVMFLKLDGREKRWKEGVGKYCAFAAPKEYPLSRGVVEITVRPAQRFLLDEWDPCGEALSTLFEYVYSDDFIFSPPVRRR